MMNFQWMLKQYSLIETLAEKYCAKKKAQLEKLKEWILGLGDKYDIDNHHYWMIDSLEHLNNDYHIVEMKTRHKV